ncbi:MAG: ISNCY family transposase, partial [Coriobacteriales bacterium]|nr:ISNCY family transposase [Coriobacteriales bacterium]
MGMSMTMDARRQISEAVKKRYARATKKAKGAILDNVVELTGWCRRHAAAVLRGSVPIPKTTRHRGVAIKKAGRDGRGRKPKYGMRHKDVLKKVWAALDLCSSRRLKAGMADALDAMERFGHLELEPFVKTDMLSMSASTMDKLLSFDRKAMQLKGRATTKPGSLLKSQIPIRRGTEWSEDEPGYTECDTVAHCGHSAKGEFCSTLDMTDVKS